MKIKSKNESFKEKFNQKAYHSRVKYSNTQRLKNVKIAKKSGNIKYVSKKLHAENGRYKKSIKPSGEAKSKQENSRIRTQTLLGSISSNTKDVLKGNDNYNQPDTGVQAVLYVSDKIDTAVDVMYSSKKVIHAVKTTRNMVTIAKEKGIADKRMLIKKLSAKGAKSGLRTARNINTQVSNQFQSEETDLGIRSFAEAEKEVRKTYDTVSAIKNTSQDISTVVKNAKDKKTEKSEYIRNKIHANKTERYGRYKEKAQGARKPKTNQIIKTDARENMIAFRTNKIKTVRRPTVNKAVNNKSTVALSKNVGVAVKKVLTFILPGKKTMLLLLAGAGMVFIMLGSSSTGMIAAISQQYFMTDEDVAIQYQEKIELLDYKLKEKIKDLAKDNSYDDTKIVYIGDLQDIYTNFQELFAVAAVKFEQDLTYSLKEEELIKEIYKELYEIKVSTEVYYVIDGEGNKVPRYRKLITVYTHDMEKVMSKLHFDDEQKAWTRRLVSGFNEQFPAFAQRYGELTSVEIDDLINNASKLSNEKQQKLYDTALSIVGRVKYFWGGKSSAGWNDDWGELVEVTAKGSDTTGKHIPFGLDCSGYVDWVYKTAGIGSMLSGGGTAYQFGQSYPIRADDLQIGDLAFLQMPNSSGINHVGIYIGKDAEDNNLYAHCEWGTGVTVNSFNGFKYFRRVVNFEME